MYRAGIEPAASEVQAPRDPNLSPSILRAFNGSCTHSHSVTENDASVTL